MLYVDYKFEMTDEGLTFVDTDSILEPDCLLKIENTPFKVGDIFVLGQRSNGCMFFKNCSYFGESIPQQLELPFYNPLP